MLRPSGHEDFLDKIATSMKKRGQLLVTGGAGYIGSHTVRLLVEEGYEVVVLDNLVYGHREAVERVGAELVVGDLADRRLLNDLFARFSIDAVLHFAAYAYVGESVQQPLKYYRNNTAAPLALLETMQESGCDQFVFSSTCATYGTPDKVPITEAEKQAPINPYGKSKLMLEWILEDCQQAFGLRSAKLRYFNACGASHDGLIGEDHDPETHLIPLVLEAAAGVRDHLKLFGVDYDTPDGTCIRDFIHVEDLADAHLKALQHLETGGASLACNLGTGVGVSVRALIGVAEEVTQRSIPVVEEGRRPGDPARLVADPRLARDLLSWEAKRKDVRYALESAWQWMQQPHKGRYEPAVRKSDPAA